MWMGVGRGRRQKAERDPAPERTYQRQQPPASTQTWGWGWLGGQIPGFQSKARTPTVCPLGWGGGCPQPKGPQAKDRGPGYLGSSQRQRGQASEAMGLEVFPLLLEAWGKGLSPTARGEGR